MSFVKIEMDSWGTTQWVDAERITRVEGTPGNWGSYMLEGEDRWVKTHMSTETLVAKIEEAKRK